MLWARYAEVLTRENHLLFVGRIQEYDRAGGRLCAELRKGEGTPGGVLYHEPVKVHIYMGQEQGKVMIAYGQVELERSGPLVDRTGERCIWAGEARELPTDGERPRHFD